MMAEMIPAAISSTASTRSELIQRLLRCCVAGAGVGGLVREGRLAGVGPDRGPLAGAASDEGLPTETRVCRVVGGALAAGIVRVDIASCRMAVWSSSDETG